jgi:hypothetical protein
MFGGIPPGIYLAWQRRFVRLLDALLEEHVLAVERGKDALAAELKTRINSVRDAIQDCYPRLLSYSQIWGWSNRCKVPLLQASSESNPDPWLTRPRISRIHPHPMKLVENVSFMEWWKGKPSKAGVRENIRKRRFCLHEFNLLSIQRPESQTKDCPSCH